MASKLSEYRESFPGVDVIAEARKARQWCIDNPAKRKTARGMAAFLSRWFSKEQNRSGHRDSVDDQFRRASEEFDAMLGGVQ